MTYIQQVWLFGLWLIWAGLLFGGFIFGREWDDHTRRMPVWTRMGSSLVLVIAAWSFYLIASSQPTGSSQPPQNGTALGFAVGMTFGFIGDLFMAKLIVRNDNAVLGGIGAFGVGHLAYILGIMAYLDPTWMRPVWWLVIVWWGIATVGWYVIVFRSDEPLVLRMVALPYTLLLSTTVGVASALAADSTTDEFLITTVGAALFLLSDFILAAQLFRKTHFRLISDVVWLTYGPGQMLIVYSMLLLLPVSPFIYGANF